MYCDGGEKQWTFGKAGVVGLQRMGLFVREISNPFDSHSAIKARRMLKPDKWHAIFDSDGKAIGFQRALKLINVGGVDPSIRPEVWEFLLGCYALDSTSEYRQQLRAARRERYKELLMQCQNMHSSVGTGSLAFVVGSKVMDVRTSSRDDKRQDEVESRQSSLDNSNKSDKSWHCSETYEGQSYGNRRRQFSQSGDLVRVRKTTDGAVHDSSCLVLPPSPVSCFSPQPIRAASGTEYSDGSCTDFPVLPVTNLFERSREDIDECHFNDRKQSTELFVEDNGMHSFQITNNENLVIESNASIDLRTSYFNNHEIEMVHSEVAERVLNSNASCYKREIVNDLRISDVPQTTLLNSIPSQGGAGSDERVSEWLWTLHQIVVDVVRTDNHLEFYEDTRNLARMSDILAVYAWIDPATGYCQGMSDLLSPFVVLFEDNADAFWCFEMLLRRMRENFQMEGPTGVMKQLEALWNILRLTDRDMSAHLSHIGAESLHFAFRMLLVLFRREVSFDEALCMWEMMWAADFDESNAYSLKESCLEALAVQLPSETCEDKAGNDNSVLERRNSDCSSTPDCTIKSASTRPFCGLTRNFCSSNDQMQLSTSDLLTKDVVEELPVFCVAAILIMNRFQIIRQTRSIDDMIKVFNDNMLKINVKRCVRMAIKLRKKYFYKMVRSRSLATQNFEA